jgi:predicted dehydrogenase
MSAAPASSSLAGAAPVGVAVIGLGVIGRRMLEQAAGRPDLRIVGAWDLDAGARERCARDFPAVPLAASPAELLGFAGTDVAYVGTPPTSHREYALMAAARGLRLFCEKPLTANLDEARLLVAELARAGTPNAVNFVFAGAPAAALLEARLREGALGDPVGADIRLFFARWPRDWQATATWLRHREQGGYVREVLSHFVYLLLRLFGDVRLLGASVAWPDDPALCERAVSATLACNGMPVTVSAAAGAAGPDEVVFTLRGSKAAMRLSDWYRASESDGSAWRELASGDADPRGAAYQAQLGELARFARGQTHRLPDAAAALRVQDVVEGILAR